MDRVSSMLQSAAPALRGSRTPASTCQPYVKHPERWNQSIDVLQSDPEWMLIPQITALSWQQALQERGKALESGLDKPGLWANTSRGADLLPAARKGLSQLPPPLRSSAPEHISQLLSQEGLVGTGAAPASDGHEERIPVADGSRELPPAALHTSRAVPTLMNSNRMPNILKAA